VARIYADEQHPFSVVNLLRNFGHDVLTVQEYGNANKKNPDEEVLAFAVSNDRAVATLNRTDFIRLHKLNPDHSGIIACTSCQNWEQLAARINEAISNLETLRGMLIRVNRTS